MSYIILRNVDNVLECCGFPAVQFSFICHNVLMCSSVEEHEVPPGLAELKQLHMESNNEHSRHLFILQLHTIVSRSQRLQKK